MLLIIEIILTVMAWKKGYKAWALVPLAITFLIGFMIGVASPEMVENGDLASLIWLDIAAVVALVLMLAAKSSAEVDPDMIDAGTIVEGVEEV